MLRSSIWAIAVACTTLSAIANVGAVPMVDSTNSTLALLSTQSPSLNNPFHGISIEVRSDSFSKAILDRSTTEAELERRIVGAIVRVAAKIIETIVGKVKEAIERDKKARGEFTHFVVEEGRKSHPQFNWIAIHTKHRTNFKGVRGTDWDHSHKEFDVKVGGTIGYEVYYLREGEVWNNGDGGWLNWAFAGVFTREGKGGKHVIFTKP
ncbi:hypothetical protein DXG01_004992 [Tephrocybe rancida]|nr:hypothetical protein DXG01_004992 [Tephrocybe rancida]